MKLGVGAAWAPRFLSLAVGISSPAIFMVPRSLSLFLPSCLLDRDFAFLNF